MPMPSILSQSLVKRRSSASSVSSSARESAHSARGCQMLLYGSKISGGASGAASSLTPWPSSRMRSGFFLGRGGPTKRVACTPQRPL